MGLDALLLTGCKVEVYWNIRKKMFSVRSAKSPNRGKVLAHVKKILLRDATFVVSEIGRLRVIKEKRKNVHAFIRGTVYATHGGGKLPNKLTYNPYRDRGFVLERTYEPIVKYS